METEKAGVTGIPSTDTLPPSTYDDKWWNELLSSFELSSLIPEPQPVSLYSDYTFPHGLLASESEPSTMRSNPRTQPYICFRRGGNA